MSVRIGAIRLPNQVALAPMAGVTDLPFRQLCRRLGAGYVVGEMLASDPMLRHSEKSRLRGVHLDEPEPRSIQIVGWDPATLALAARYNVDQGASVIDINMGCPAKKVCKRDAGSALLADEDLVARILEAVVAAVAVPVTLKIRTGVAPSRRNAVSVARIAEQAGIQALAVHGRTRACKYLGHAEYDTIRDVVAAVSIPVFANGDISSGEMAAAVLEQTGASGVMLGRAAHGRPWLPGQVAEFLKSGRVAHAPDMATQRDIVLGHLDDIHHFYGSGRGVRIARKHIKWYTSCLPGAARFQKEVNSLENAAAQFDITARFYSGLIRAQDGEQSTLLVSNSKGLASWQRKNHSPVTRRIRQGFSKTSWPTP